MLNHPRGSFCERQHRARNAAKATAFTPLTKILLSPWFKQLLMGSFLIGSLRQVWANLRGRAKTLEMTVPKSLKKGCHANVQTTHAKTTH